MGIHSFFRNNTTRKVAVAILFLVLVVFVILYSPAHWSSSEFYFDGDAESTVMELIREADYQILIEMFSFTHKEITAELERAKNRGVDVRVIVEDNEENSHLLDTNFEVRWDGSSRLFHRKLAIFDAKWIWIGSTNWTYSGMRKNAEVDMLLASPDHALDLVSKFEYDWRRANRHIGGNN
ncbi:MAG TPA: phospholipase D family protein [Caldisericia bacterium]|nr:phospholipase D family protein [Caldisericia bacterium]HPF49741.1 phospholipase D family protein [Caldisericia bacterium]HPI84303.1 phospholipase D family protein [Caldisericia bacterium]HPQ93730.1 phospholipase D family protein [Caldisericia bacterium]HRV74846.1 phospholipase D family protein [Caldisericia bacterium]